MPIASHHHGKEVFMGATSQHRQVSHGCEQHPFKSVCRWFGCMSLLFVAPTWCVVSVSAVNAQATDGEKAVVESEEEKRERITAERFLQLLERRPRLGTALDKVYGYHVGRGSLDAFCEQLETTARQEKSGAKWMILGMVLMQRGQDAQAVQALEQAETLLPEEPLASFYLGKTLVLLGEVDDAADAMRRAIERKPARADVLQIFQDLGRIYQRTGRNQDALEVWKDLEALFPGDTGVQEQIAAILAEEGAEEAALERYSNLATTTKDRFRQVEMAIRAAQLKAKLGKSDEALDDFEQQLAKVNPESWLYRDIRRRIEEVFWASSDFDGLVDYYTEWTNEHPEDVDAMLRTARVLSVQKRMPEARQWFSKAIERAPSNIDARQALVEALATDDLYDEAAEAMEPLVELQPNNPDLIVRWGELVLSNDKLGETERKRQAAEIWMKMLEARGDDPVTVSRVADLLRSADLSEEAIVHYKKAIELADTEPQYREYLGEYLHQLRRKEEALEVWEALASGPRRNRDNLVRLSEVLSTFGYDEKALATIEQACELMPTFGHRARYAELLREAGEYDQALAQLDQAESLADDRELRELVMEERIKNYQASGVLKERINELESAVAGDSSEDAAQWRVLALLREANRAFQPACDAIEMATQLAAEDVTIWETAASLYERTGRFGEAVVAYRKLSTLDRRFLTNYLTQIASLEMRLGNVEQAVAAGEELLAAAPGNSENYRFYANLCMQAGETDRGLDALRRNVRSNPNDADALEYLAKTLADEFQTDEAIELYWRSFDIAKDVDSRRPVIEALTELYLRTNRFDMLLDRLEIISREENKPRDGTLWIAAAHQAAGDLGMARQLLEQLVREDSRDTSLLEQLVGLSKSEFDFETAAEYQKRLVAISPSAEREYLLATLLMELGEVDLAEGMWLKLSTRSGRGNTGLLSTIDSLVGKQQFETAGKLASRAIQKNPDNWELLGSAMIIQTRLDDHEAAVALAQRVESLDIEPSEPTQKTKEAIKRAASRRSQMPPGYDPYSNLGTPARTLDAYRQIKQALSIQSDPFSSSRYRAYSPTCFADVKAIAVAVQLVALDDAKIRKNHIQEATKKALDGNDVDALWHALSLHSWEQPYATRYDHGQYKNDDVTKCIDALVDLGDSDAAGMKLSRQYNSRMQLSREGQSEAYEKEELDKLLDIAELVRSQSTDRRSPTYEFWIVDELRRAERKVEADALFEEVMQGKTEPYELLQAASMSFRIFSSPSVDEEQASKIFETAVPLCRRALDDATSSSRNATYVIGSLTGIIPPLCEYGDVEDATDLLRRAIDLQARLTADMRPSQRDRASSNVNTSYSTQLGGNYQRVTVEFPPPSGYFGNTLIVALHSLVEGAKRNEQLDVVQEAVDQWVQEPTDDPYLKFARLMAKSSVEYWTDNKAGALAALSEVDELSLSSQFTSLVQARMQYDSGDVQSALQTVESLRPSNQKMLVDRELTLLQLVLQLGDLDRAKKSAQKLFALRLDSATEFKLADLMYQLGMKEMGDRMMGRIRRRAGGKQDTLVQLMQRYATANEFESATEIARQIIRRTRPASSTNYRTSENVQHQQALQVLVRAKQIDPLIEQYEQLVERSPKSLQLVDKLASIYEAAGRREDAQKLRLKAAENAPADPRNLMAAGQQLAASGATEKAVEKFVEAIRKGPDQLNNSYYEMRDAFNKDKSWPKMVDMMAEEGFDKFTSSYRVSEICYELIRAKQFDAANKLFRGVLEYGDWYSIGRVLSRGARDEGLQVDDDVAEQIADKLCDPSTPTNNVNYVYSMSNDGVASGVPTYLVEVLVKNEAQTQRLLEELGTQVEENPKLLFSKTILAMLYIQLDELEKAIELVEPMVEQKVSDRNTAQAMWCIASAFSPKEKSPEMTAKILESFDNLEPMTFGYSGLNFQSSPANLLVTAYENLEQHEEARERLVTALQEIKVDESQNQYNPGYGEYQYINAMDGLSQRLLQVDAPAEAFIAYRKAYGDPTMLKRAERWGGSWGTRASRLEKSIKQKMTAEVVLELVQAATLVADEEQTVARYLVAPEQTGESMADSRVELPLEQFVTRIKEDENAREAVVQWLGSKPFDGEPELGVLVSRLVVCHAVDESELLTQTAEQVKNWVDSHPPVEAEKPAQDDASRAQVDQELMLSIAARSLPNDKAHAALGRELVERAITAAKSNLKEDLAFGLRLQLAQLVAQDDREQARGIFKAALDDLLPASEVAN